MENEKTLLNYKIDTVDGKTYAGTRLLVRDGIAWLFVPHIERKADGNFEPLKVFRLGIPLQKIEQIRQKEKSTFSKEKRKEKW